MKKTKILCIFDGFGIGPDSANNCITRAKMPYFRRILKEYYWTTLNADGEGVGQEDGLVGNSEVGHMNLGGLQLVRQLSYQITKSAEQGFELETKDRLFDPKEYLQSKLTLSQNKTIHLVGLFSTGTIHSDMRHWIGSIEAAGRAGANQIILHLITDGRDSDRQSLVATWQRFTTEFETRLQPFENKVFLGSVGGRFYAMDRDKNWERVLVQLMPWFSLTVDKINKNSKQPFGIPEFVGKKYGSENLDKTNILMQKLTDELKEMLSSKQENELKNVALERIQEILQNNTNITFEEITNFLIDYSSLNYQKEIFDETLIPASLHQIQPNDMLWLLNFRSDRMKQITTVLCDLNSEFELNLDILAMNDFGIKKEIFEDNPQFSINFGYKPIFQTKQVKNTLAETISNLSQTQLHIAETEKYAHVTYFLNGGSQDKHNGEDWVVIPSNKVESHAEKPEMKAREITDYILENGLGVYDYIIVNYANPDMVAHTGLVPESVESVEFLDQQLGKLLEVVEQGGHSMIITADHGNCEFVGPYQKTIFSFSKELNKNLQIDQNLTDTEHNPNAVLCIIVNNKFKVNEQLDFNANELLKEIKNNEIFENLDIDYDLLQITLEQKNYKNLDKSWLSEHEIKEITKNQLPLWYAGVLLTSLII
jgi:2,3-bisphosphoglycerate-independent phosphoglycerate mutase